MAEDKKYIYYIGKDLGYANNLKELMRHYQYIDGIEFVAYTNFEPHDYQKIFCELVDNGVRAIFLDFTTNADEFVTLANLIKRDFHFASASLTLLIDSNDLLPQTRLTMADFVHLKHGETHDVMYDAIAKAFPKIVHSLDFALAKFKQDAQLREDVLVSYVTPTGCYIETNAVFGEGDLIELDHNLPKKMLPSRKAVVKKVKTHSLIYDYLYGYELAFQFLDEPQFTLEEEESENFAEIKERRFQEYNDQLTWQKKQFKKWVEDQANYASANFKVRVLIYDEYFSLLKHGEENSKKYPFSVRFQTCLEGTINDVGRLRPEIIAMQFDPLLVETEEEAQEKTKERTVENMYDEEQTNLEKLTELMRYIKGTDGYKPYIIIFNTSNYDSKNLQSTFNYPFILVNKDTVSYSFIKNISELFQKKQEARFDKLIKAKLAQLRQKDPQKYGRLRESDLRETKFFIDKRNEYAYAFVWTPIKIFELTESEISFVSEKEHVIGSRYAVDFPMKMHVTLVPTEIKKPDGLSSSWNVYHGLLSCLHELQKQDLRRFVNKIFFADLDAKKAQEAEEFERIKQEALQRKLVTEQTQPNEDGLDEDSQEDNSN